MVLNIENISSIEGIPFGNYRITSATLSNAHQCTCPTIDYTLYNEGLYIFYISNGNGIENIFLIDRISNAAGGFDVYYLDSTLTPIYTEVDLLRTDIMNKEIFVNKLTKLIKK